MGREDAIPLLEELNAKRTKWDRIEKLLNDDEAAFAKEPFCEKLPNETEQEYRERAKVFVSSFINPTQSMISAPGAAVFGNGAKLEATGQYAEQFAERCTRTNDRMPYTRWVRDHVMAALRAYGTVFTVVDKPRERVANLRDELDRGMPYLYNLRPQDVLNYRLYNGELVWFAYRAKMGPEWLDPVNETENVRDVEVIWTRDWCYVRDPQNRYSLIPEYTFQHGFGLVPVVIQATFLPAADSILGVSAFEQTSRMLIKFNTRLGLANYELDKHGKSLLLMHDESISGQNMATDNEGNTESKRQDKGNVLVWGGTEVPSYLVKELVVKDHMDVAQYYLTQAFENERDLRSVNKRSTSFDDSGSTVQQSGFAKMVDREPLEHNLVSLADDGEAYTQKVEQVLQAVLRTTDTLRMAFDKDYDLQGIAVKLDAIQKSAAAGVKKMSPTLYREQWKNVVPDVTDDLDVQAKAIAEIDEADVEDEMLMQEALRREERNPFGGGGNANPDEDDDEGGEE